MTYANDEFSFLVQDLVELPTCMTEVKPYSFVLIVVQKRGEKEEKEDRYIEIL